MITSFGIITYWSILLSNFFYKKFKVQNYLAFYILILFWNNSIIYNIFNPYQAVCNAIFQYFLIEKIILFNFLIIFTKKFFGLILISYFKNIFLNKKKLYF